jgi:hypothetical protein
MFLIIFITIVVGVVLVVLYNGLPSDSTKPKSDLPTQAAAIPPEVVVSVPAIKPKRVRKAKKTADTASSTVDDSGISG